jgi:hypothetical protein
LQLQTSSQTILLKKAKRLRALTGNDQLKSKSEIEQAEMTPKQVAQMTLFKPFQLNFSDPILFALNLYLAFVYAVLYSWFEAFPLVYEQVCPSEFSLLVRRLIISRRCTACLCLSLNFHSQRYWSDPLSPLSVMLFGTSEFERQSSATMTTS